MGESDGIPVSCSWTGSALSYWRTTSELANEWKSLLLSLLLSMCVCVCECSTQVNKNNLSKSSLKTQKSSFARKKVYFDHNLELCKVYADPIDLVRLKDGRGINTPGVTKQAQGHILHLYALSLLSSPWVHRRTSL